MRDIPDCAGYALTKDGQVWSHKTGRFLKPYNRKDGYLQTHFWINGKKRNFKIHRLVALTFIPKSDNRPFVNHINGIKTDNRVENLEWCTQSENLVHGYKLKLRLPKSKRVGQFTKCGTLLCSFDSTLEVERTMGLANSNISACALGKKHHATCGGFIWKYL